MLEYFSVKCYSGVYVHLWELRIPWLSFRIITRDKLSNDVRDNQHMGGDVHFIKKRYVNIKLLNYLNDKETVLWYSRQALGTSSVSPWVAAIFSSTSCSSAFLPPWQLPSFAVYLHPAGVMDPTWTFQTNIFFWDYFWLCR